MPEIPTIAELTEQLAEITAELDASFDACNGATVAWNAARKHRCELWTKRRAIMEELSRRGAEERSTHHAV